MLLEGRNVLVVDDSQDITESQALVLECEGYSVRQANSGNEACQKLDEEKADVVLTDHSMPDGNGFVVIEKCRVLGVPVIMISDGRGTPGLRERALEAGARAFLNKPAGASELLAAVREATRATP